MSEPENELDAWAVEEKIIKEIFGPDSEETENLLGELWAERILGVPSVAGTAFKLTAILRVVIDDV